MLRFSKQLLMLLAFVALSATITFCYILTMRYELKTGAVDGLTFAQLLYNALAGRGLSTSIQPPFVEQNWLGFHFSPVLYILIPVYYLFPYIETLLFIQSLFIALAAIPIFLIARTMLKSDWHALVIALFYLINPFVINAQIWDFHEIAFAPLAISMILWSVVSKNRVWLCVSCAILFTIKEHYGLAVFGTGLLWAWHWREPRFGITLSIFGLLGFFVVIKILMPHFNPLGVATMLNSETELGFFGWLNHPFSDSGLLIKQIANAVFYCILLIAAFWFQPLFSFMWLLPSIADMAVNTLSTQQLLRAPYSYHSAAIIPVLLIAYTKTISTRYTSSTKIKPWEMLVVTAFIMLPFSYGFAALPGLPNNVFELSSVKFSLPPGDKSARGEIINIIGGESSVASQVNILPHIPVRRKMYSFPDQYEDADYIVINTKILFERRPVYFTEDYFTTLNKIMNDKNWGLVFYRDNWLLFKHGAQSNPELLENTAQNLQKLEAETKEHNKRLSTRPSHQQ